MNEVQQYFCPYFFFSSCICFCLLHCQLLYSKERPHRISKYIIIINNYLHHHITCVIVTCHPIYCYSSKSLYLLLLFEDFIDLLQRKISPIFAQMPSRATFLIDENPSRSGGDSSIWQFSPSLIPAAITRSYE